MNKRSNAIRFGFIAAVALLVIGSDMRPIYMPWNGGNGNANTLTNPTVKALLSGSNATFSAEVKSFNLMPQNASSSRIAVINGGGGITNITGTPTGLLYARDDNTLANPLNGNGVSLTNIPLAALQTNSTLNAQIITFNGTTWVPSNAPAAGSTQLVALAVGDFTGTNSILSAVTNQLDIGSWSKPVRTNWANDFTAKDGFLGTGSSNGRLGLTDTNGTTNVVISADSGGQVTAAQQTIQTNTAAFATITPANLHSITVGKGWTNDLGARADMVISIKYVDAATGDPKLAFTNSITGEAWTNQVSFGLAATYSELLVIPDISPSDRGSFTDLSGTGASITFLTAWWKLK